MGRISIGREVWRIVGVYVRKGKMDTILEVLDRRAEEKEEGIRTIVGGDFNARTGWWRMIWRWNIRLREGREIQ